MDASRLAMEEALKEYGRQRAENVIYLEAEKNNAQAEEIEKDNPEAVQRMLEFLYLHNYSGGSITPDTDTVHHGTELILHAKIYSAGCKHNIPTLKMAAVDKFQTAAKLHWELDVFCEAVRIVFTTTPNSDNELREVVATIICSHNTILGASTEMDEAVRTIDGLGYWLWKRNSAMPHGPNCNACGNVSVKECARCAHRKSKKFSANHFFAICECLSEQQYCSAHQNTQGSDLVSEGWEPLAVEYGNGAPAAGARLLLGSRAQN
ncbi:hypothetical protein CBER1_11774 [Cercospora berteroae]|uniref:BTB domain-containing protein n=1 Tax=Cercospora berteroae TaxID=357750 RepID=A0A2S6BZL0_9PEZI|nr:hypothetical protein CBER1_11774 [Cercospora berteroae]